MFDRTRLRLTLLYVVLFTVVLCAFSIVLFLSLVDVLTPSYDAGPDLTAQQAASAAYQASIDQMGLAIVLADLVGGHCKVLSEGDVHARQVRVGCRVIVDGLGDQDGQVEQDGSRTGLGLDRPREEEEIVGETGESARRVGDPVQG